MTQTGNCILSPAVIRGRIADRIAGLRGTSTKAKSARAVMALGVGTFAGRGTRFVKNMVLAKFFLAPDQLGLMAIIMSFTMAFEALIEVGVKQSVIQNKRGADKEYLNAAWWMQLVRGMCLFAVTTLLAPRVGAFYDDPALSNLLRVAFLGVVLRCLISPRTYVLEKQFKFGQAVFLLQGSAVLGAAVAVGLAAVMRSVWALVLGFVAEMGIMCVLSFILVPFLPRFKIDRGSLSELLKYARGMFGLPVLTALSFQAPVLILGKVISKEQLGLYSMAAILAYMPVDLFARVVAPVLLPAFSEKQENHVALCRGICQGSRWTAVIALPLIAFMVCSASELLSVVYTPEYVAMATPFVALCIGILARSETVIFAGVFMAIGQPHLQRRFAVVRALVIIALMYPAALRLGPAGAAAVIVLSNVAVLLMQIRTAGKVVDLGLGGYVRSYVPGVLLALPIIVCFDGFWLFGADSPLLVLTVGGIVFAATYVAAGCIWYHLKSK